MSEDAAKHLKEVQRILLVDDETLVLEALERSMFELDEDLWEVVCEQDPAAAVELLRTERFDVVISDMRMPGIDGAALLELARRHQPHSLRVVLSGQSNREAALRSVPVAHRFLAKPCRPNALIELIERSRALDRLLGRDDVQRIARSVTALPSRPRVYDALLTLVEREETTIGDIAELVESEPALCAQVLHLVNSAFFALPRQVRTIREAVNFLGTQTLQSVVLCSEVFRPSKRKLALDLDAEQARAFVVGACARELGGDPSFTAGILHRVGCLVLALAEPKAVAAARCDHASVGAYLLGSWGVSHDLVEAVAYQHLPPIDPHAAPIATALHVAVGLHDEVAVHEAKRTLDEPITRPDPVALAMFSPDKLEACRDRLRQSMGVEAR